MLLTGVLFDCEKEDHCALVKCLFGFVLVIFRVKINEKTRSNICKCPFTKQNNDQCYEHAQFDGFSPEKEQSGRWPMMENE